MKSIRLLLSALAFAFVTFFPWFSVEAKSVSVRGHYRKDGTYVQPHMRSAPDGNVSNNWSTRGNINPYTGEIGTKDPLGGSTSGDVYVDGYIRSDGTYVQPHIRSAPDGNKANNWSTQGNINPYTGEPGSRPLDPGPSSYQGYPQVVSPLQGGGHRGSQFGPSQKSSSDNVDVRNRMSVAEDIRRKYGKQFDWNKHSFLELSDIRNRMSVAEDIRRKYGKQFEWSNYSFLELSDIRYSLRSTR